MHVVVAVAAVAAVVVAVVAVAAVVVVLVVVAAAVVVFVVVVVVVVGGGGVVFVVVVQAQNVSIVLGAACTSSSRSRSQISQSVSASTSTAFRRSTSLILIAWTPLDCGSYPKWFNKRGAHNLLTAHPHTRTQALHKVIPIPDLKWTTELHSSSLGYSRLM